MKERARGFLIGSVVLMLALPVLYVGSEGAWYLATDESHFAERSTYRTIYTPLDAISDRWPAVYNARESLANCWQRFGSDPDRRIYIRGNPWPGFTLDVF